MMLDGWTLAEVHIPIPAFASVQLWIFAQPKQHGVLIQAIMSPDQVSRAAIKAVTTCNSQSLFYYLLLFVRVWKLYEHRWPN